MNISERKSFVLSTEMRVTLLVALSAILYGCLGFFGTQLIRLDFTISAMLFWRFFIAVIWMLPFVFKKADSTTTNIPSQYLTILVCTGCSLIFLIITLATHEFVFPTSFAAWFYIIAVGIVAIALPIQLLLEGLKHIQPSKVAILSMLEPVVTLIVGITALNETASTLQLIGCVIILLSAIVIQFER